MSESPEGRRESLVERFRRAAQINASNWREPQHDLDAIRLATEEERGAIEQFLLGRGIQHFMDAEALACLDTPSARQALIETFRTGPAELRAAVVYLAPQLIEADAQVAELVRRIDVCDAYCGLSLTLTQIEAMHLPAVIEAMLRRIARDPGVAATHFAGLLLFLHHQASEPFDWEHRPFLLRFNAGNETDRREAFAQLCHQIGYQAASYDPWWPIAE